MFDPTLLLREHGLTHSRFSRAYIGGTFDLLHRGHLDLFAKVRRIADETIVSLNRDEFVARYKRVCVMPLHDRHAVISALRGLVDRVVVNFGDEDSKPAIDAVRPDCIIHGDDWQGDSLMRQMSLTPEWLEERGIRLVIVPYSKVTSTSKILDDYFARAGVVNSVHVRASGQ
jgi:cytidyltransferase-like protein